MHYAFKPVLPFNYVTIHFFKLNLIMKIKFLKYHNILLFLIFCCKIFIQYEIKVYDDLQSPVWVPLVVVQV